MSVPSEAAGLFVDAATTASQPALTGAIDIAVATLHVEAPALPWTYWDGAAEQPVAITYWDGAAEQPLSHDQVFGG